MKKLIFQLSCIVMLGTTLIGCQKEELQSNASNSQVQQTTLSTEAINQTGFTYNYEVVIKGAQEHHYAKYRVSSNDENTAIAMVKDLENSTLRILRDKSQSSNQSISPATASTTADYKEVSYDFEKGVHLTEIEKSIGENIGYEVMTPDDSKRNGFLNSYSTITVTATGIGLYTRNMWIYPNYNYHYYYDISNGWSFVLMATLSFNEDYHFMGGGFAQHKLVINPSYINGSFQHNNKIYWQVL